MAIPIEKTFQVQEPVDQVWNLLSDPKRVATCVPGAKITEQVDDKTYRGTITLVVPTMLTSAADIEDLAEALEVRFLANRDRNLHFGLLTDFPDADQEMLPQDAPLLELARRSIEELNAKYGDAAGGAADDALEAALAGDGDRHGRCQRHAQLYRGHQPSGDDHHGEPGQLDRQPASLQPDDQRHGRHGQVCGFPRLGARAPRDCFLPKPGYACSETP